MSATVIRCDCGHDSTPTGVSAGYGRDDNGRTSCFDCCTAADLAEIATAEPGHKIVQYLSCDGSEVTNWPGRRLMGGVSAGERHPWSAERYYVSAVDAQGRIWSGVGAPGMYTRLRLTKRAIR